MERLICIAIGYLFGLIQTGYIYGILNHVDIRKHGSGNAGTTNALRTLGWKAGVITFLGDCLKCILAVALVRLIFAEHGDVSLLAIYAGLGVVLGHNYPFYLNFKGGKGIAATAGLVLSVNPVMFLSIALYGQSGGFGLETAQLYEFYIVVIVLAGLAFFRHRENIVRLIKGTENKTNIRKIGKK